MISKWANGNEVASRTEAWDWQVQCVFPWISPFLGAVKSGGGGFPGGTVVENPPANAGDWVRALVREDPTCCGAAKPVRHNYRACALEPASHNY